MDQSYYSPQTHHHSRGHGTAAVPVPGAITQPQPVHTVCYCRVHGNKVATSSTSTASNSASAVNVTKHRSSNNGASASPRHRQKQQHYQGSPVTRQLLQQHPDALVIHAGHQQTQLIPVQVVYHHHYPTVQAQMPLDDMAVGVPTSVTATPTMVVRHRRKAGSKSNTDNNGSCHASSHNHNSHSHASHTVSRHHSSKERKSKSSRKQHGHAHNNAKSSSSYKQKPHKSAPSSPVGGTPRKSKIVYEENNHPLNAHWIHPHNSMATPPSSYYEGGGSGKECLYMPSDPAFLDAVDTPQAEMGATPGAAGAGLRNLTTGCCGRAGFIPRRPPAMRSRTLSSSYSALDSTASEETASTSDVKQLVPKQQQVSECVKNLRSWVSSVGDKVGKGTSALLDALPSLKEDHHVVMIGLDSAGKSTVLYRLKFDQYVNTVPTIGFNCERVRGQVGASRGLTFLVWDVGGQEKLRPLWKPYTRATDAVIFVVDSTDVERLEEARMELHKIMRTPDNVGVPLLVIANKQDLPSAKAPAELEKILCLSDLGAGQLWHLEAVCAVTGEGLDTGLEALHSLVVKRRKQKKRARNKTR